ncbi:hypothetical protein HPB50_026600 [Hyalomma asiaticum]|uniref:Uncharacterized protein n=1 Tax=Hyalomma asiaticum TaxID=266040 RepID=A0ACB7TUY4_HYAAI|nr:hypothetical protein HPB50_026600 [Hyalomma asiaticum]
MKQRSKNFAVEKSDSRAEGRRSRSPSRSERLGPPVSPRKPPEEQIEQQPSEDEDSTASPSSSESTCRTETSIESVQATDSTTRTLSFGSSEFGSSVATLEDTHRTERRAKPLRANRRRPGLRSWWRSYRDHLVVAALGLFIVGCVGATVLDRWLAVQTNITTPGAPSVRKTARAVHAPAVPAGKISKPRVTVVTTAVGAASTKPSAKGFNRHHAPATTTAPAFEAETSSEQAEPGGTISEPYSEEIDSTTTRTRSTRRAAVQGRRRRQPYNQASTTRRRGFQSWRRSRGAVIGDDSSNLLRRKVHAAHRPPPIREHRDYHGTTQPHPPSQKSERCGAVRYTFCPRLRREVFYDRESDDCVAVTTAAEQDVEQEVASRAARRGGRAAKYETPLCNSSPNRFSTAESCRQTCQKSSRPPERCFDKTIFSECGKEHVTSAGWFFDGRRCRAWHFPAGRCPDASAFRTRNQCTRTCSTAAGAQKKKQQRDRRCGPPRSQPCGEGHLRFPFFADVSSGDGRVRCLKASQATLVGRRCLLAPNRFPGVAECRSACVRKAVKPPRHTARRGPRTFASSSSRRVRPLFHRRPESSASSFSDLRLLTTLRAQGRYRLSPRAVAERGGIQAVLSVCHWRRLSLPKRRESRRRRNPGPILARNKINLGRRERILRLAISAYHRRCGGSDAAPLRTRGPVLRFRLSRGKRPGSSTLNKNLAVLAAQFLSQFLSGGKKKRSCVSVYERPHPREASGTASAGPPSWR